MGGKDNTDAEGESLPEGFGSSFSNKSIRMKFVRKVYSILLIQLLVTTGIIALIVLTPPIRGIMCSRLVFKHNFPSTLRSPNFISHIPRK